jgi:pyruvate dehydrogenase E2 component (dihydrolipoamide acetyltransferase)
MESGVIVKWLKSEGDKVEKGDPLYELDTEKVTQEVEAEASGVLLKIVQESGEAAVGTTIALIGEEGEKVAADAESPDGDSPRGAAAVEVAETPQEEGSPAPAREPEREHGRAASADPEPPTKVAAKGGRVKASPLARRIARERGVDLAGITGTGPDGRVVAEDVERGAIASAAPAAAPAVAAAAVPEGIEVEQLSSMRKTIARRLTKAWQAPAFQITMSADMTRALALRAKLVELGDSSVKPTLTDVLTKLCAAALMRHRDVNVNFVDDAIHHFPSASIGIAVAIPKGLVVPVIPSCDRKSIEEIAAARAAVVERAKQGKLQQSDLQGGTFTISNLGMYGVENFVAVLTPPQAAILAVGATEDRVVARDGAFAVQPTMALTLTCDHRALDGATASEFLRTVKRLLEEPGLAL